MSTENHEHSWVHYATFRVFGIPKAQPRARRSMHPGKVYTPEHVQGWKLQVFLAARDHLPKDPFCGPVRVDVMFLMPRPKALTKKHRSQWPYHTAKPDKDNLEKAVLDVLQHKSIRGNVIQRGFWKDDSQVSIGTTEKRYADDVQPGAVVSIQILETELS